MAFKKDSSVREWIGGSKALEPSDLPCCLQFFTATAKGTVHRMGLGGDVITALTPASSNDLDSDSEEEVLESGAGALKMVQEKVVGELTPALASAVFGFACSWLPVALQGSCVPGSFLISGMAGSPLSSLIHTYHNSMPSSLSWFMVTSGPWNSQGKS